MATKITKLSLNSLPTDLDYEDFISAHLLLGGFTLDRSIHEKVDGAGEIFEVDIITHQYEEKADKRRLVEIKSKGWELNDVFKVGGRLRYLGVDSGVFIVQQKGEEKKFSSRQASMRKRMDVSLVYAGKKDPADTKLDMTELYDDFGITERNTDDGMLESIRFSYIAERCMRSRVSQLRKSQQKAGLEALWDFSNAIQDISFYDDDPVQRLHRTFELFKEYNHLSARLDYEHLHGIFPDVDEVTQFESGRVKGYLLNEIDYLPVNYSLYLEHRLRMYILQSCVEYLVMPKEYQGVFDKFLKDMSFNALSSNITQGIEFLSVKCPNFRQYPLLWQLFTYMMGGFVLTDHYNEEIELLGHLSGIPATEVKACFSVYDILFPTSNNWLREIGSTHIKRLNFMPSPLMGIGANFRRDYYRDKADDKTPAYEDLKKKLSNDYTFSNLMRWNQAAFELLKTSSDLKKS